MKRIILAGNGKEAEILKRRFNVQDAEIILTKTKEGEKIKSLNDYLSRDFIRIATNWEVEWRNKKLMGGKTIKEILSFDGISAWWMINTSVFLSKYFENNLEEIIVAMMRIKKMLKVEKPDEIYCFDNKSPDIEILKKLRKKVKLSTIKRKEKLYNKLKKKLRIRAIKPFLLFRAIARKILYGLHFKKISRPDVLIFGALSCLKVRDKAGQDSYIDVVIEPLVQALWKNNLKLLFVDKPSENAADLKSFRRLARRMKDRKRKYVAMEKYLSFDIIRKSRKIEKRLQNRFRELAKNKEFRKSLEFDGINFWNLLEKQFETVMNARLNSRIRNHLVTRNTIEKIRPKAVYYKSEVGPVGTSIIDAAKKTNIPIIASQHGTLHTLPNNVNTKEELDYDRKKQKDFSFYRPIPDVTTTWGKKYFDFFMKESRYNKDDVKICGFQRYDAIINDSRNFDVTQIRKELGIKRKRVVFYASQPVYYSWENWNERLRAVVSACKEITDVHLVIKLHPAEESSKPHQKIVREQRAKNVTIIKDYDINKIIFVCDVLTTLNSGTTYEALILNKPVIIINTSGYEDSMPFVRWGIALGVYKKEDAKKAIEDCLERKKNVKRIMKNVKRFLLDDLYSIDGKSSERIVEVIEKYVG